MAEETIVWSGKTGQEYTYYIYPIEATHADVPANYIYSRKNSAGRWMIVYIGETSSMAGRPLKGHHKEDCIRHNGATHIHTHANKSGEEARRDEEADILEKWGSNCND